MHKEKRDVIIRRYLDDELTSEKTSHRMVYTDADGDMFINDSNRRRQLTSYDPPTAEFHAYTVKAQTFQQVLDSIPNGQPIQIVVLGSD